MGFIGKTELARELSPEVSDMAALRRMMRWIERNEALKAELRRYGYDKNARLLTDIQAKLIRDFLCG